MPGPDAGDQARARRADAVAAQPQLLRRHPRPDPRRRSLLLLTAQWAPSCGNAQPAAFVVAERGSPSHEVLTRHLSRGNSGWVPRASAGLHRRRAVRPRRAGRGRLQAALRRLRPRPGRRPPHAAGAWRWGCTRTSSPGFDKDAVAAELGVPAYYRLMSGIAVGVPGNPDDVPSGTASASTGYGAGGRCADRARRPVGRPVGGPARADDRSDPRTSLLVVLVAVDDQPAVPAQHLAEPPDRRHGVDVPRPGHRQPRGRRPVLRQLHGSPSAE